MPVVVYNGLDKRVVSRDEIQAMLDALEAGINTNGFNENDVIPGGIKHRHLKNQPRPCLFTRVTHLDTILVTAFAADGDNWYAVKGNQFEVDIPHSFQNNRVIGLQPVFNVMASYRQVDGGNARNDVDRVCIGYSTDGGTNYTPIIASMRPAGFSCGSSPGYFDSYAQNHYMTGAGGWYPPSEKFDRNVQLAASFGGFPQDAASNVPLQIALMINGITNVGRFTCSMEASIRWTED
jgi:hypothetical protein